jgi:hypothetical protein
MVSLCSNLRVNLQRVLFDPEDAAGMKETVPSICISTDLLHSSNYLITQSTVESVQIRFQEEIQDFPASNISFYAISHINIRDEYVKVEFQAQFFHDMKNIIG